MANREASSGSRRPGRQLVADIVEKVCDLASFLLWQLRFGNFGWWPCGRKGGVTRPAFPERYWSVSSGRGASDSVRLRRGGMCGGREEKFVVGSVRTPEPQAREAKNTLERGEQHLDFFPPTTGLHVLRRADGPRRGRLH